jgi:dTDP-4-dehydrorhamnose reductase
MANIFAVVLTYNRKDLLRRCLGCVLAQSHPCTKVIVIDNCSSDGTVDMLRAEWGDRVQVHVLSRNIGASGGFNVGIRIAYQGGADFVWVMDDDVMPEKDALAKLIEAEQFLEDKGVPRAFVLSAAWTEDGTVTNVPRVDTRRTARGYENWPLFLERKILPVRRATFVSILLPRSVIAQYGLPLAPMFIWGEDSEYTLRITKERPGFFVADSKVLHLRQLSGAPSIVTEVNRTRLKYHRYLVRNQMYTARVYSSRFDYLRQATRQLTLAAKLVRSGAFEKAGIVLTGLVESFWFRPSIESAQASAELLGVTIERVPSVPGNGPSDRIAISETAPSAT